MLGLHRAALPRSLDPLGAAAAGAVQAEPAAARLQPALNGPALGGIGIRPGHVRDEQPARRQPFLDVGEVVGGRGRHALLGEEPEQFQAGVIVVVPGERSGWKPAGDEVRAR